MGAERFRVVLQGRLVEGHDPDAVAGALAEIFNTAPKRFLRLFNGEPAPVKRVLSRSRAEKLRRRVLAAGAQCRIERCEIPEVQGPAGPGTWNPGVRALLGRYRKPLFAGALALVAVSVLGLVTPRIEKPTGSGVPREPAPALAPLTPGEITRGRVLQLARNVRIWMIQFGSSFDPRKVSLERVARDMQLKPESLRDVWGRPLMFTPDDQGFAITSSGPDGSLESADDLSSHSDLGL